MSRVFVISTNVRYPGNEVGKMIKDTSPEAHRAGLRKVETQEAKLALLRATLKDGEESGPSTTFDFDDFVLRKRGLCETQAKQPRSR